MKNADEIKKGLACCAASIYQCEDDCPYREGCRSGEGWMAMNKDALALIQQLEAERDAAVRDLTEMAQDTDESCEYCEMFKTTHCSLECRMKNKGFKWRGVQKEE